MALSLGSDNAFRTGGSAASTASSRMPRPRPLLATAAWFRDGNHCMHSLTVCGPCGSRVAGNQGQRPPPPPAGTAGAAQAAPGGRGQAGTYLAGTDAERLPPSSAPHTEGNKEANNCCTGGSWLGQTLHGLGHRNTIAFNSAIHTPRKAGGRLPGRGEPACGSSLHFAPKKHSPIGAASWGTPWPLTLKGMPI